MLFQVLSEVDMIPSLAMYLAVVRKLIETVRNRDNISRPECLTKIYNSLARYVKKIAPYTELLDIRVSTRDENYGEEYEYRHKEYITKTCLNMRNNEGDDL